MSERIRELREAAWTATSGYPNQVFSSLIDEITQKSFQQKFAELIIRECAEIAKKEQAFNARYSDADNHPQVNIDQCILVEFGL